MASLVSGPARERIDRTEFERLRATGAVILDARLRRPLYFDGRFLAARDLTREQNYFLTRQADLGRIGGQGVVAGLMVSGTGSTIRIEAGHGVTPAGEMVLVPDAVTLDVSNIPAIQTLDAAFGLIALPRPPARTRSGLFVLGLRPVEFTANPIAAYPTSINGPRTVEDGDIIQAVAISLIPYPDEGGRTEMDERRSRAARQVFVQGKMRGIPADVLPLAMLALDGPMLQWLDPFLVRREVSAEQGSTLGFGFSPRALREAHVLQYQNHLRDVLIQRSRGNRGDRFAASEHFLALPAAGTLPPSAINPDDFTQIFFPPQMNVDLSVIPDDELAPLVEESLVLPPIDLSLGPDELESTSILVLVPVPRGQLPGLRATLGTLSNPLRPATPGLLAQRKPIDALLGLTRIRVPIPILPVDVLQNNPWRQLLAQAPQLWYIRRRNIQFRADVTGAALAVTTADAPAETNLNTRLLELGLADRVNALRARATALGNAEIVRRLSSPALTSSRTLMEAAVRELETPAVVQPAGQPAGQPTGQPAPLDQATVVRAAEKFSAPNVGEGVARIEAVNPELAQPEVSRVLAESGAVPELDKVAARLDQTAVNTLAGEVLTAARTGGPEANARVAEVVRAHIQRLQNAGTLNR